MRRIFPYSLGHLVNILSNAMQMDFKIWSSSSISPLDSAVNEELEGGLFASNPFKGFAFQGLLSGLVDFLSSHISLLGGRLFDLSDFLNGGYLDWDCLNSL